MKKLILSITILFLTGVYAKGSWVTKINGTQDFWVNDVTSDQDDNIYAVGGFEEYLFVGNEKLEGKDGKNIFFAKFNSSGTPVWVHQINGEGNIYAKKLRYDGRRNIYMAIEYENAITIGKNKLDATFPNNMAVAKFDESGNVMWVKNITGKGERWISGLTIDPMGHIYVAGGFKDNVVVEGSAKKAKGENDAFIFKLNPQSKLEWLKQISNTKNAEIFDIAAGTDVIGLTGTFTGTLTLNDKTLTTTDEKYDAWIASMDQNGNINWVKHPMGSNDEIPTTIAVDNADNIIVAGSFKLNMNFGPEEIESFNDADVFLAKYDAKGDFQWVEQGVGNVRNDVVSDMVVNANGDVFLIGTYLGSITFDDIGLIGPSNVNGPTAESIYVVKCTTDGKVTEGRHLGSVDKVKFNIIEQNISNDLLIAANFDEFVEDPGNSETKIGNSNNAPIYLWETSDGNSLFRSEKSIK